MSYWLIFLTGLTTGGLTCLALQGGLLASAIIEENEEAGRGKISRARAIILFLLAKLVAYTVLGILLGFLGKFIGLTPRATGILNILIALFMLGVAGEALRIHPIFKYFLIQPPKFIRDWIYRTKGKKGDFAAVFLGILTVLIPCGTTQAMMAYAVSSANFWSGAIIMFTFILGTIPVFFILGYLATTLGEKYSNIFRKVVAIVLIALSVFTFSNAFRLLGVRFSGDNNQSASSKNCVGDTCPLPEETESPTNSSGNTTDSVQKISIKINDSYGYDPASIRVKAGVPIELTLIDDNARGCIRAFVIPKINQRVIIPSSGSATMSFTLNQKGTVNFTCSMGMYDGKFIVE